MKKLYSIGETAKIMGISSQTLRNYSNMNIIQPQTISAETGYRYYSFEQFHFIDRIKYLRGMGLSLKDIADILREGKPEKMITHLGRQKKELLRQINELNGQVEELQWYIDYFLYLDKVRLRNVPYIRHFEERYVLFVTYGNNGDIGLIFSTM